MKTEKRILLAIPATFFFGDDEPIRFGFCLEHDELAEAHADNSWSCRYERMVEISTHSKEDIDQYFDPCLPTLVDVKNWMIQNGVYRLERKEDGDTT